MSQKKHKTVSFLSALIIGVITLMWNYFQPKQSPIPNQEPHISVNVADNYDYIMRDDAIGQNKNAKIDYYTLVLSWSPGFCDEQRERYNGNIPQSLTIQCGAKQYGWVIHGLWPQNANARSVSDHPRFCQGDLPMVDPQIIKKYLLDSPSAELLQGEWEKHGACRFNRPEDYFEKQQNLYRALVFPNQNLSRKELFAWMKSHNPTLKTAYLGASRNELFICYDLNWKVINCPH